MAEYTVLEKDTEYIPAWDDNQDKADKMVFTLKYISNAERARCMKNVVDAKGNSLLEFDNEQLVKYGIASIEGFSVNGKAIVTARDFNSVGGFPELHNEIATQVLIMNGRQDLKNSE